MLNFGIVGGGGIAPMHLRGATMDFMAKLSAGCFSSNPEKGKKVAGSFGLLDEDRIYPDYKTMAEEEGKKTGEDRLDFVSVVTPNTLHFDVCKAFLMQGINVVCDKPVTTNLEDAYELKKIAEEKGLLFGVSYTYGSYGMIRQMREMIDHGEIGEINYINAEFPQEWLALGLRRDSSTNAMWRMDPAAAGGSLTTADIGTHIEYMVKSATGLSPVRLLAKFNNIPDTLPMESCSTVLCEYPNGITGLLWSSQVALGHECEIRLRIFGSEGSLEWNHTDLNRIKVAKFGEPVRYYSNFSPYNYEECNRLYRTNPGHPEGLFEAFGNIYRSFMEVLIAKKEGRKPESFTYPTIDDGINGVRFVDACVKSNKQGSVWVDF